MPVKLLDGFRPPRPPHARSREGWASILGFRGVSRPQLTAASTCMPTAYTAGERSDAGLLSGAGILDEGGSTAWSLADIMMMQRGTVRLSACDIGPERLSGQLQREARSVNR